MANVIDQIQDYWFSLPYYKRKPLGEEFNKNINNLPGIRQWNEFQESGRQASQANYEENEAEGGLGNQLLNSYADLGNTLNNGLSTVISAPIKAAATLLHVDPSLLNKTLTIAGLGRGIKGVKPRGLKTVQQEVLPTTPTSPPKALTSNIQRTINLNRIGTGNHYGYNPTHIESGHATAQGLTFGIPAATKVSPIPTAPLVAANANGLKKNGFSSTPVTKKDPLIYLDPKYKSIDIGFENTTANQTFFQKRADLLKSTKLQDQKYGIISTPPNSIDSSPLIYSQAGFSRFWQHLHHLDPKAESSAFLTVAEEIGGERGLLNAYAFMRNRGVGGGNKASDILFMNDWPHHMLHQFRIEQGLQPSKPDWLLNSGKKLNLTDELRVKVDGNLNNLMKLLDGWVEDNWKPSRAKAFQYQREYVRKWNSILDDPGKGVWDQKDLGPRSIKSMREQPTNVQKLYEDIPEWYSDQSLQLPPGSDESIKAIMRQMGLPLEDINWLYKETKP